MTQFLWTFVIFAALNTASVMWLGITDQLPQQTPLARAIDAVFTAGMGAWALWLLARGV